MWKKLNYIFDRGQKLHAFFLLAAFIIGSGLELLAVAAILPLVNAIVDPQGLAASRWFQLAQKVFRLRTAEQFVIAACLALIVIYVVKNVYLLFMYYIQFRYTYNNKARISTDLLSIYMDQSYLSLVDQNVADLTRSVTTDVDQFFALILALLNILCEGCTALALMTYLLLTAPVIMLSLAVIVAVSGAAFTLFYKKRLAEVGERIRCFSALRNRWFLQAFNGIKEIKVLDREEYFKQNYRDATFRFAEASRAQGLNEVIARPFIETACIGGLLAVIAMQIAGGAAPQQMAVILSAFAVAAMRLLPSLNRIMSNASSVMASLPSLDALYNDKLRAEVMRRAAPRQEGGAVTLDTELKIEHVRFTYPHKTEPVLNDVSLVIPKNRSVALIGPSGAGKTTLADIILGLMEPQQGHIFADGKDIYQNLAGWHRLVAYIPQSIYLIDDTIRANVLFGLPENEADDEAVWAALRSAQLEDFVRAQPEGLDTRVGDRGVKLSGGQRQRIGIARALYHAPEVLVLDEATSALDTDTETAVMESINRLQGSKTLILIAHRLSTVRNCDLIYEVRDGKVLPRSHKDVFGPA